MDLNEWVMSCDNPTRARYDAHRLWQEGIGSEDRTIIIQQYGYNEHDADILCAILARMETTAEATIRDYNPDIGF